MKSNKLFSIILSAVLMLSSLNVSAADTNNAIEELKSYNVLTSHDADTPVTRGEMACVSLRLQGIGSNVGNYLHIFADVSSEHEYASSIIASFQMGVFSGYGDGNFYPDNIVTAEQAIKVIVASLGYDIYAAELGGYPHGYIAAASKINLLKGIELDYSKELTRGELALMILNILDEYPLVSTFGDETSYHRDTRTVRQLLEKNTGTVSVTGRIVENGYTSLYGASSLDKNQIKIGSMIYNAGDTPISEYLGMEVTAFVDVENTRSVPTVIGFYVNEDSQKIATIACDDVDDVSLQDLSVVENDRTKTYKFAASPSFIYNGKYITPSQDDLEIFDGSYTLIDFDSNNTYDVIFITEKESFVVDRVYQNNLYFGTGNRFRGANGFSFDYKDDDTNIEIYNADGDICAVSDITDNMSITFVCSADKKLVKAYISDQKVTGTLTAIDASKSVVCIDDEEYELSVSADGTPLFDPKIGMHATFLITCNGKLLSPDDGVISEYSYAYADSCRKSGAFGGVSVRTISGGSRLEEKKTVGNTTTINYKIQNGEFSTFELAENVTFNGVRVKANEISPASIEGTAIAYKLNSENQIKELKTYAFSGALSTLKVNTDIFAFGGFLGADNFLVTDATQLICVPESPDCDDDYYVLVTLADNSSYTVFPIEIDEETQVAQAAIVVETMDSSTPTPIDSDTKASIVGRVSSFIDQNGDECCKLQILNGDTETELLTKDYEGATARIVRGLSTGDVIKYSLNAFGRVDNIDVLASLYNVDDYFRTNPNTLREKIYGQCYEIKRHRLSEGLNEFVDEITVRTGTSTLTRYEVLCTDGPYYYIFERRNGLVMRASSDDVFDSVNVGEAASNLYMFVKDNEPQVVVIVKE